jgi:hypothetical protein
VATLTIGDKILNLDDAEDLMNDDAIAVEKAYGKTFDQWLRDMNAGSITAITVFVWILRRLNGEPGLRVGDVHFRIKDLIDEDADKPDAAPAVEPTEVVPGGATAEFDPANPTPASEASTADASDTSQSSPTSTESIPPPTDG